MDNNETLYFISKCLGLCLYPEREQEIRNSLKSGDISWEKLVWVSSNQLVLPALYVQFREYNLLKELPSDLTDHLEHLYQLNKERNEAIIKQTLEIVTALNSVGIAPVLLKGTAHLFDCLYKDIGERMIGDIDFLVDEDKVLKTVEVLNKKGYANEDIGYSKLLLEEIKHYPRLRNRNVAAAIEIHRQPVSKPYDKKFNYKLIDYKKKRLPISGEAYVLSDSHQIIHNMMNAQMNDKAYSEKKILLRSVYDLYQLSKHAEPVEVMNRFKFYKKQFNAYLILSSKLLGSPNNLNYEDNWLARRYYRQVRFLQQNPRWYYMHKLVNYFIFRFTRYVIIPFEALTNKAERKALIWRLTHWEWYKTHWQSFKNGPG